MQEDEEKVPDHHIINGENVMLWPVRDGQQFGLDLMSALFTKKEMIGHLCFTSKQRPSPKPKLPQDKVATYCYDSTLTFTLCVTILQIEQIVGLVLERFPETNIKSLKMSMNQKCR